MSRLLFFVFLISSLSISAQEQKAKLNHYIVKATLLDNYNIDSKDLSHGTVGGYESRLPSFLKGKNRLGYQLGFEYEHTFKNNISLSSGLLYGRYRYGYMWNINTDYFFDRNIHTNEYSYPFSYNKATSYITLTVNVGYKIKPFRKSKLILKPQLGVGMVQVFRQTTDNHMHYLLYQSNDTLYQSVLAYTEQQTMRAFRYYTLTLYAIYPFGPGAKWWLRELRLGVEYMHLLPFRFGQLGGAVAHSLYYNSKGDIAGSDLYTNRFRNIAITIGWGL